MDLFDMESGARVFRDRDILQETFVPDELAENTRDSEIQELELALRPILHGNTPDNVLLRGPNGSGKTAVVRLVLNALEHRMDQDGTLDFSATLINGSQHNTGYQLSRELANMLHPEEEFKQGHSASALLNYVAEGIANLSAELVVVAIDELKDIEDIDELLYLLTRPSSNDNLAGTKIGVLATTTDTRFKSDRSPDVLSTFGQRTITFDPYTADELRTILKHRVEQAFIDEAVESAALSLCAALASQQGGDARFALDILKYAGDIASQSGDGKVTETEINAARERWATERVETLVTSCSLNKRLVLYAIVELTLVDGKDCPRTKAITTRYEEVAQRSKYPETVSDRMITRYLLSFVDAGLLDTYRHQDQDGTWRTYEFAFDVEYIKTALKCDFQQDTIIRHSELRS